MRDEYTYNQFEKSKVRHISIKEAIEYLTIKRGCACSVETSYVRNIYDYFTLSTDGSSKIEEAKLIDTAYIRKWEKLHASCVGSKRPEELKVCYLCGPEPRNDFQEFTSMGILSNNIWAFELDGSIYKKALKTFEESEFPQPHIVKQNIESFMKDTPKKFDIIYIDACGSIPSSQHALRCVTSICKYQRLESPGIILSNFTEPDKDEIDVYLELVSLYMYVKEHEVQRFQDVAEERYAQYRENVKSNFFDYYSNFISAVLRDIPAVIVPLQRLSGNQYLKNMLEIELNEKLDDEDLLRKARTNSISSFFLIVEIMRKQGIEDKKINDFIKEIGDYTALKEGIQFNILIKDNGNFKKDEINELKKMLDSGFIYQFLDKVHLNMFLDIAINQMTYPYHNVLNINRRYSYIAKTKKMYTDLTVYDECRYLYEWIPAVDQMKGAFLNKSWQYVFRFGLDGLIKQRIKCNNEFFFQGSVVSSNIEGFEAKEINERVLVEE